MSMNTFETLYDKLCEELKDVASKPLSSATLESADKLTHAMKNLTKLMDYEAGEDGEYSMRGYPDRAYRYEDGTSMARGRRNAKRDSRGRYSSRDRRGDYSMHDGDMVDRLYDMLDRAKDESERKTIQRMIEEAEK